MSRLCGWCMTGYHDSCKPRLDYFDKTWYCTCTKCGNDKTTQGADENEQSSTEILLESHSEE